MRRRGDDLPRFPQNSYLRSSQINFLAIRAMTIKSTPMPSQATTEPSQPSQSLLLDKQQVADALGISIRTIDNLVKAKEFPPGVRLGRCVYWSDTVVKKWRHELFAAQEKWRRFST